MSAHLAEVIRSHAHELLSRHETKRLVDRLNDTYPKLVEELVPKLLTLGELQRALQSLLRESVSIRDLGSILEGLIEAAVVNKNPVALVEAARQSLSRSLVRPLLSADGELKVVTLSAPIEEECMRAGMQQPGQVATSALNVSVARRVLDSLRKSFGDEIGAAPPVILCSSPGRFYLRRILEPFLPKINVNLAAGDTDRNACTDGGCGDLGPPFFSTSLKSSATSPIHKGNVLQQGESDGFYRAHDPCVQLPRLRVAF